MKYTALIAATMLAGCISKPTAYYGTNNVLKESDKQKLAVVEFGEFGSYREAKQIDKAVELIRSTSRPLVITYVHGWHNHAASGDLKKFEHFLKRLSTSDELARKERNVVGIYMTWPGESLSVPVLNTFTFWDRKRAAERIAANADCLDGLLQISRAARASDEGKTIVIGHSFGALVVERSVAHTVKSMREERLPWDLVLLLNPASDSILTRQMVASFETLYKFDAKRKGFYTGKGGFIPETQPTIVELASENDLATGLTFPWGSGLGAFMGANWAWNRVKIPGVIRDPSSREEGLRETIERDFYLSTPGNNQFLINYAIREVANPTVQMPPFNGTAFDCNLSASGMERTFFTDSPKGRESFENGPRRSQKWRQWEIADAGDVNPKYRHNPKVPFWIVRVPTDIIDNHGGIWSDNSAALMAAIFRLHYPRDGGKAAEPRAIPLEPFKDRKELYQAANEAVPARVGAN